MSETTAADPDRLGRGAASERRSAAQRRAAQIHARLDRALRETLDQEGRVLKVLEARGLLVVRAVDRSTPAVFVHRPVSVPDSPDGPLGALPPVDPRPELEPSDVTPLPLHVRSHTVAPSLHGVEQRFDGLSDDPGTKVGWIDELARTARATQVLDVLGALLDPGTALGSGRGELTAPVLGEALAEGVRTADTAAVVIGSAVGEKTASAWIEALPDGAVARLPESSDPRLTEVVGAALLLTTTGGPALTVSRAYDLVGEVVVDDTTMKVVVSERRVLDHQPDRPVVIPSRFTLARGASA